MKTLHISQFRPENNRLFRQVSHRLYQAVRTSKKPMAKRLQSEDQFLYFLINNVTFLLANGFLFGLLTVSYEFVNWNSRQSEVAQLVSVSLTALKLGQAHWVIWYLSFYILKLVTNDFSLRGERDKAWVALEICLLLTMITLYNTVDDIKDSTNEPYEWYLFYGSWLVIFIVSCVLPTLAVVCSRNTPNSGLTHNNPFSTRTSASRAQNRMKFLPVQNLFSLIRA